MYKLVIVEDEPIEREGLTELVDWNSYGIEIADTARNGLEALELSRTVKPDIVITDIRMPFMTGLELIEKLKKIIPEVKSIIISGYGDFEYAREAIGLNTSAYILKPVDENKLDAALKKVVTDLNNRSKESKEKFELKRQLDTYQNTFKQAIWQEILNGGVNSGEIRNYIDNKGILDKNGFIVLSVQIVNDQLTGQASNQHIKNLYPVLCEAVGKKIGMENIVLYDVQNRCIIIILIDNGMIYSQNKDDEKAACREAKELQRLFSKSFKLVTNIGIGLPVKNVNEVEASYNTALEAKDSCFYLGKGIIVAYNQINDMLKKHNKKSREKIYRMNNILSSFLIKIRAEDTIEISRIDELFKCMADSFIALKEIKSVFSKFVYELSLILNDINSESHVVCGKEEILVEYINETVFIEELKQWFISLISDVFETIEAKNTNKDAWIVSKVMEIVKKEYFKGISLRTISETVNITPNYIGTVFKKKTDISFNDFLNQYRIERAKEILHKKDVKIADVAQSVGIPNESYFCVVFKNITGMSPGRYQEMR